MKYFILSVIFLSLSSALYFGFFKKKNSNLEDNTVANAYNSLVNNSEKVNETFYQLLLAEIKETAQFEQECLKASYNCALIKNKFQNLTIKPDENDKNSQARLLVYFSETFESQIKDMQLLVKNINFIDNALLLKINEHETNKTKIFTQYIKLNTK